MTSTYQKFNSFVAPLLLLVGIYLLGYQINRENFPVLLGVFAISFFAYLQIQKSSLTADRLFQIGLLSRVILICSIPALSDDYFRFIWDGKLIQNGYNPFAYTPTELIDNFRNDSMMVELFENMNSKGYFTVYPPINQWIFFIAAYCKSTFTGIIALRVFIISFEIGTYFVFKRLMKRFSISPKRIALYWLNPLVIIELTGNLHGEGILLFFLLLSLLQFAKLKDMNGGILLSLSVLSKLLSLILLPLILLKARWYRSKKILLGLIPLLIICFWPFLNFGNFTHFLSSLNLYFQSFEFNASIFNGIKTVCVDYFDFHNIKVLGPILATITFIIVLFVSFINQYKNRLNLFRTFAAVFTIYLFLSPVVHPWYCIIPLALGILVNLKYTIAWSALIFLSYSAYSSTLSESLQTSLLVSEYGIVFFLFYQEIVRPWKWHHIKSAFA